MSRVLGAAILTSSILFSLLPASTVAEHVEETELKFAFYSSAWGENTDDGLRLVALNKTAGNIHINSIKFHSSDEQSEDVNIDISLEVPSEGYAEIEFEYIDLLTNDECISRTMEENWRLVEISNYTLNPSVRNLIIEDTDSFRIYQCVKTITTNWTSLSDNSVNEYQEWVLYHFENRRDQ
jgi:hypothetical protein